MVWLANWIRENVPDSRVLVITGRTGLDAQIEKVFKGVDEHIHRTQSGKLHKAMKTLLPEAVLIGFTGTPLLKKRQAQEHRVLGPYIHTYKYDQAVNDGVVLDLRYQARDIDQQVTNQQKIDQWFELKTQGLNDYARAQLKRRWGTPQKVLSSRDRLEKIVADMLWDMATGAGETEQLHQYDIYRRMLVGHFDEPGRMTLMELIVELTRQAARQNRGSAYPADIDNLALQALYDNLGEDANLAIRLDERIRAVKRVDWRGNRFKERELHRAIESVLETQIGETRSVDVTRCSSW
ncbi:hypothetical protein [Nitrococcus mobilis]|uniref:Type I restriction enzyme restriction subunit n=1 Tax=Nitrococcus mobilis Nb-231 TaxID=314278 RepID=A4BMC7_9GAMM|nr:hypothetical protein [Nitrococcus mobilis]EAR23465.1 type I restriction enzyme restriction subunit [Nitrococcus mobilis Nb-231]